MVYFRTLALCLLSMSTGSLFSCNSKWFYCSQESEKGQEEPQKFVSLVKSISTDQLTKCAFNCSTHNSQAIIIGAQTAIKHVTNSKTQSSTK